MSIERYVAPAAKATKAAGKAKKSPSGARKFYLKAIGHKEGSVKVKGDTSFDPKNPKRYRNVKIHETGPSNRFVGPKKTTESIHLTRGQKARTYKWTDQDRELTRGAKGALLGGVVAVPVIGGASAAAYQEKKEDMKKNHDVSAFGISHGEISKAEQRKEDEKHTGRNVAIGGGATVAGGTAVAMGTKIPEHSHYSKKTRKYINNLPPGVHEVDTKMLAKKPRKLGARKQQTSYVAAMAHERPAPYSPVPITRYKDGVIQRDNAHSVMANAMKGRKTLIKIEDAPGYRPRRRTGEELVRRAQGRYQQRRLKQNFNLSERAIQGHIKNYKPKNRAKNTAKRPHGVVEDTLKYSTKPYKLKRAIKAGKNITMVAKRDNRDFEAGVAGTAGVGALAATPVRRSARKVDIKDGKISSSDAKKIVNPGYRPGNKRSIKVMARNLGHLENSPTKIVQYKDGGVIPFDGNHRATARIARGDKHVPVKVIEGGERPAISITRNLYHGAQQRIHRERINRGAFTPNTDGGSPKYTGKHAGETKVYSTIANGSPTRSGRRVNISNSRIISGPSKMALRGRQAATVGTGAALLGVAHHLHGKKEKKESVEKRQHATLTPAQIKQKKRTQARVSRVTGTLGLAALTGTALATRPGQKVLRAGFKQAGRKMPKSLTAEPKEPSLNRTITPMLATSAGIGSLGAFNFARYTGAEAEKGKRPIKKSYEGSPFGDGFFGSEGRRMTLEEIDHAFTD